MEKEREVDWYVLAVGDEIEEDDDMKKRGYRERGGGGEREQCGGSRIGVLINANT